MPWEGKKDHAKQARILKQIKRMKRQQHRGKKNQRTRRKRGSAKRIRKLQHIVKTLPDSERISMEAQDDGGTRNGMGGDVEEDRKRIRRDINRGCR